MSRPADVEALLAHREWVRALSRAIVGDPARAADVEQSTWLTALRRPPRVAGDLKSWFGRVVRSRALDAARESSRRAVREERAARRGEFASAADVAARFDTERRVAREVAALPEPLRTTVLLRFYEELSVRDVARRMGVPYETARARLKSALARLRRALRADDDRGLAGVALLGLGSKGALMASKHSMAAALLVVLLAGGGFGALVVSGRKSSTSDDGAAAPDGVAAAAPRPRGRATGATASSGRRRGDAPGERDARGVFDGQPPARWSEPSPALAPPSGVLATVDRLDGTAVDADTGLPLNGVRTLLFIVRADGRVASGQGDTTGADGKFRNLRPNGWDEAGAHAELRIAMEGYETVRATLTEAAPVVRLRRQEHPALPGRVAGVARDGDGRPLSGTVLIAGYDEIHNNAAQYVVADAGGAFVLEGVPAGYWRFSMLNGRQAEVVVPEGGEARMEVVVAKDPRSDEERVHGTNPAREGYGEPPVARDADGRRPAPREVVVTGLPAAPGTVVRASIASLVPRLFWRVEAKAGEARFPSLSPGRWTLAVVEPGRPAVVAPIEVVPGDAPQRTDLGSLMKR